MRPPRISVVLIEFSLTLRGLFLPPIVQQVQAGHADHEAVGDLIEDDRMRTVGDFGSDLDAAIDWAGGENQHVRFGSTDAVAVHAEEVRTHESTGRTRIVAAQIEFATG